MNQLQSSQYALLNHRFETLMFSLTQANDLVGRELPGHIAYEDSEQGFARRELLHVEKVAIQNKKRDEMNTQAYIDAVRNDFHKLLLTQLEVSLSDTTDLFRKTLGLDEVFADLLDMLAVKACSIARLEPLAARIPWLYDELLKVVNAPQHRRKDSRGRGVVVETLRAALSFINIDNLQLLIPSLMFRRTIPQITDPYPQIKARVWQQALSVSLSARYLAPKHGVKENDAFVFGMLQAIGRNAVTRTYFKLFEKLQREELERAQAKKERDRHDALTQIQPSGNFLVALWNDYADPAMRDIIEHMRLSRVFVGPAAEVLGSEKKDQNVPLALLTRQARIYSQYRLLHAHKLINQTEAKVILRQAKLTAPDVEALNKIDVRTLPLNIKPDLDIEDC